MRWKFKVWLVVLLFLLTAFSGATVEADVIQFSASWCIPPLCAVRGDPIGGGLLRLHSLYVDFNFAVEGTKVTFIDNTQLSGVFVESLWDFGDGQTKETTDVIVEHEYVVSGGVAERFTVTRFVCNPTTCSESKKDVWVYNPALVIPVALVILVGIYFGLIAPKERARIRKKRIPPKPKQDYSSEIRKLQIEVGRIRRKLK
jgi:hypothetical protein